MDEKEKGVKNEDSGAPQDTTEQKGSENEEGTDSEESIDYKAEYEKIKADRDNYREGLKNAKDIMKKKNTMDPDEFKKMISEAIEDKFSVFTSNLTKSTLESKLDSLSSSPDEKELIRYHYENSIVKSGIDPSSIATDLENAKLLANRKSIFKKVDEMKISLNNRQKIGGSPQGGGSDEGDGKKKDDFYFSEAQLAELRNRGFTDEKIETLKQNIKKKENR